VVEVILPVLDEAAAIPGVLAAVPPGFAALVVDNGSRDGSAQAARAWGARVISEPRRGFGSACFAGLMAARADVVCFMDCDGSLDPGELARVAGPVLLGATDLCLGARVPAPGAWPWHARLANRALARELRRRTGAPLTDLGPMRAARRQALLALALADRGSGWPLEMVLKAGAAGWRISEVAVTYRARSGGRSKVTGSALGTARAVRDMGAQLSGTAPHRATRVAAARRSSAVRSSSRPTERGG
jgi:glycosyltransferase involved in cell wall biosynthesis